MPFTRFVEIGRICTLTFGKDFGTLCAIVDVVDQNRVMVEGPKMPRQMLNIRRVNLTPFKVQIPRAACSKHVVKAMEEGEVQKKFDATSYGKLLIARKHKLVETDFDRFQRHLARHPAKKH